IQRASPRTTCSLRPSPRVIAGIANDVKKPSVIFGNLQHIPWRYCGVEDAQGEIVLPVARLLTIPKVHARGEAGDFGGSTVHREVFVALVGRPIDYAVTLGQTVCREPEQIHRCHEAQLRVRNGSVFGPIKRVYAAGEAKSVADLVCCGPHEVVGTSLDA